MKLKFSWGTGIAIFIVLFICFYISLMLLTRQRKFHMVSDEYYPESIEFESRIKKTRNAQSLKEKVQINIKGDSIQIVLPDWESGYKATGTAYFYRPNNSLEDMSIPLMVNKLGEQVFKAKQLKTGRYIVKMNWQISDIDYYDEISIYIP